MARPAGIAPQVADDQLIETSTVHAELRLGLGLVCGRKRITRLMRAAGLRGVCHQRKHRHVKPERPTGADSPTSPSPHIFCAADGWIYCCAVIDAFSRRVVGWSLL